MSRRLPADQVAYENALSSPREHPLDFGAFCVSIDLELAWGIWDRLDPDYLERCRRLEAEIVDRILSLFERHQISATWAVVGRLLERREEERPNEEGLWYAPGLVDRIRASCPSQEIGSHSYAHPYFGTLTPREASADLQAARRVHAEHGTEFVSFVYPRNDIAHLAELRDAGIRVFRGADRGPGLTLRRTLAGPLGRAVHLLEKMLPLTPAVVHPLVHAGGLVEIPGSMLLLQRHGLRRLAAPAVQVLKARNALRRAAAHSGIFHLWFHPSNFYYDTDSQFRILGRMLEIADDLRARGLLRILPMKAFADAADAE